MSWLRVNQLLLIAVLPVLALCSSYDDDNTFSVDVRSAAAVSGTIDPTLYQLPGDLKPTKYNLTIVPFLDEGNFTFYGKVEIDFTVVQSTSKIVLNSKYLTINSVELLGITSTTTHSLNDTYERLIITVDQGPLRLENSYQVIIEYTGLLKDDLFGFYRSSYESGSETKWLGVTQFAATHARRAFPCFDEPKYRAVVTVNLGRFTNQTTASNMRLLTTSDPLLEFENRVIDTYEDTPTIPTYLVAFLVGEMASMSSGDGKFTVRVREDAAYQAQYLLGIGETVLNVMGEFLSVPYPLPKMDVVGLTDSHFEAMENWGMTTFREKFVLYEEGVSSARDKHLITTLVSHEMSHQWFGDLVTPQWWSYTWLNEAFATFFEYNTPNTMDPTWKMWQLFIIDSLQYALALDVGDTKPIIAQIYTPAEINAIFDYVIYDKGGSVLRMTDHFLRRDVFRNGLHYYIANSSVNGIGVPEDLFRHLDAAAQEAKVLPSGLTVARILTTWTTQAGFPLLTVNRTSNGVTVSQKLYSVNESASTAAWYIPLTYTTQTQHDFEDTSTKEWFQPSEQTKTITTPGNEWIIFNLQQTGFYRVNYDVRIWELLIKQLLSEPGVIHVNNRAQLVDDAFHLAKDGHIEHHTALDLSVYLSQEREFVPWTSAMNNFKLLFNRFYGTNIGNYLQSHVSNMLLPYYQYLMNNISASEPHLTTLGRIAVVQWACDLGISDCETYASSAFQDWLNNGIRIGENVKAGVLCTGLKLGGDKEWEAVWNLYMQSNNYAEKETIMYALGCTQSKTSIARYLNTLGKQKSDIRRQDADIVFNAVVRRPSGVAPAIRYFVNNFDALLEYSGKTFVKNMATNIGKYVIQGEHIQLIRDAVNNTTLNAQMRAMLNTTLATADSKKSWVSKYHNSIQAWVSDKSNAGPLSHLEHC